MSRFNHLRLAYRLGLAFGAMVLALVVIGAVAVTKLGALNDAARSLSDHDVVTQGQVLEIKATVQRASYLTTSHLYVHDGDLAAQDRVAGQIAAVDKTGDAALKRLDASVDRPELTPFIARLKSTRARFVADYTTAVRARGSRRFARTRSAAGRATSTSRRSRRPLTPPPVRATRSPPRSAARSASRAHGARRPPRPPAARSSSRR